MADPYSQPNYRHPDPKISGGMPGTNHHSSYDREGYPAPPGAASNSGHHDPSYFPPPPRSERGIYEEAAGFPSAERGFVPTERGSVSDVGGGAAQMTPYDEEKAYAQYTDAYGAPVYGQQRPPPPPSTAPGATERSAPRRGDWDREEERRRYEDNLRRHHASPPPSTTAEYDSEDYESRYLSYPPTEVSRRRSRRRRSPEKKSRKEEFMSGNGDRGFGATLLGGAAGAFLGDHVGKGKKGNNGFINTIGGALVGAIGANALERQVDKREKSKEKKEHGRYYGDDDNYSDLYKGARAPTPTKEFRPRREGRRSPRSLRSRRSFESDDGAYRSEYRTEYSR